MSAVAQNTKRMVKAPGVKAPPKAGAVAVRVHKNTEIHDLRGTHPYPPSYMDCCLLPLPATIEVVSAS